MHLNDLPKEKVPIAARISKADIAFNPLLIIAFQIKFKTQSVFDLLV